MLDLLRGFAEKMTAAPALAELEMREGAGQPGPQLPHKRARRRPIRLDEATAVLLEVLKPAG